MGKVTLCIQYIRNVLEVLTVFQFMLTLHYDHETFGKNRDHETFWYIFWENCGCFFGKIFVCQFYLATILHWA